MTASRQAVRHHSAFSPATTRHVTPKKKKNTFSNRSESLLKSLCLHIPQCVRKGRRSLDIDTLVGHNPVSGFSGQWSVTAILGVDVQTGSSFYPSVRDRSRAATGRGRSEKCEPRGAFSMLSGRVARSFAWLYSLDRWVSCIMRDKTQLCAHTLVAWRRRHVFATERSLPPSLAKQRPLPLPFAFFKPFSTQQKRKNCARPVFRLTVADRKWIQAESFSITLAMPHWRAQSQKTVTRRFAKLLANLHWTTVNVIAAIATNRNNNWRQAPAKGLVKSGGVIDPFIQLASDRLLPTFFGNPTL